jgi:enoyl-CoA hydratase/carnithine racemase
MSDLILTLDHGAMIEIVLNRPDKRNAINWPMMEALSSAFDAVERSSQASPARVVVIRAEGPSFSAGIDLMGFPHVIDQFGERWRDNLFPLTTAYQAVTNKVERCSLPVIALLHGHCLGLGMELALACDFRIAAEDTRLGLPEAKLGLIPDVGGTTRLTRLIGVARAKEYIMTGREFDLQCAQQWGLVNHVVAADQLLERGRSLADELIAAAPLSVSYAKRVINELEDVQRGLSLEAWAQSVLMRSEDFEHGAHAALTRQTPTWKGK